MTAFFTIGNDEVALLLAERADTHEVVRHIEPPVQLGFWFDGVVDQRTLPDQRAVHRAIEEMFKVDERPTPPDAAEQVAALPRRTAHVTHALIAAIEDRNCAVRTSEVVVFDSEALDGRATGNALASARKRGLCIYSVGPRLWTATVHARDLREALEDRFLEEVKEA